MVKTMIGSTIAVSRVTRQFAIDERGFSPDRLEVFPNAVDHSSFRRPTAPS